MLDEHGKPVDVAGPSRPVQVLGLSSVPGPATPSSSLPTTAPPARSPSGAGGGPPGEPREGAQADLPGEPRRRSRRGRIDTLNLILKGDVSGSVEALEDALLQIDVGDEVDLRIIDRVSVPSR